MTGNYEGFGKAFIEWLSRNSEYFFYFEVSENIMELAQEHGLVKRVPYDPEKHGPSDLDPGDPFWYWGKV